MLKLKRTIGVVRCLILVVILNVAGFVNATGLQKFFVRNNDAVVVTVSSGELSRFIFEGDEVERVYDITGEFYYEMQGKNLYIKPSVQKPINFFVDTESGNTYQIIATPKDIPATQIFINGVIGNASHRVNQPFTGEAIYQAKISKIIKAVKAEDTSVGYKVKYVGKSYQRGDDVSGYFDSEWSGDGVIAEKHFLFNDSGESIKINKNSYLDDETEAVYTDCQTIKPNSSAILIKVRIS